MNNPMSFTLGLRIRSFTVLSVATHLSGVIVCGIRLQTERAYQANQANWFRQVREAEGPFLEEEPREIAPGDGSNVIDFDDERRRRLF